MDDILTYLVGTPIILRWTITPEEEEPVDLSGYGFRFGVKTSVLDPAPLFVVAAEIVGTEAVVIVPAETHQLAEGTYRGVVEVTFPAGNQQELLFPLRMQRQQLL